VVARIAAAGATVKPDLLDWDKARADPQLFFAIRSRWSRARSGQQRARRAAIQSHLASDWSG